MPLLDNRMAPIDGLDMSYRVGRCQDCGFLFADHLPDPATYARYYHDLSKYDVLASADAVAPLHQERASATIKLCRGYVGQEATIADLGCGPGYLLWRFRQAGWGRLFGLDPARASADRARDLFGLADVHTGLLRDAGALLPMDELDLVCLAGVLEHLWSPAEDLRRLIGQMRQGSLLLIEVPGLERFDATDDEPFGEFSLEHIQYFSRASLVNFMRAVGAEPLVVEYLPMPPGMTESLFGLFRVTVGEARQPVTDPADADLIDAYLERSADRLHAALSRLPDADFLLFGAGSHTARLLPALASAVRARVQGVFDSNANLHGRRIDGISITPSAQIADAPALPVVVSSYRAQTAIAAFIAERATNPVVLLY